MRTIGVLVNGDVDSAAGARARGLFEPLSDTYEVRVAYRQWGKGRSLVDFTRNLVRWRPDACYVVNPSVSGTWAGVGARLVRICPFVLDTGDVAYSLARLVGNTTWFGCQAIRVTEGAATRFATSIVVRGTYHKELLERSGRRSVHVVRDGVHASAYDRPRDEGLRARLGIGEALCVGLMGSLRWSNRLQTTYGWDLVEAMALVSRELPLRALIIGDGDGLPHLRARAAELGVTDRIVFAGAVPAEDVAHYVQQLDIALSTQTNNDVGWVRTTGKLPEYMAAGCYVLATDVGEARLLLPPEMRLPYVGVKDTGYPHVLSERIQVLASTSSDERDRLRAEIRARARRELDYSVLSSIIGSIVRDVVCRRTDARALS